MIRDLGHIVSSIYIYIYIYIYICVRVCVCVRVGGCGCCGCGVGGWELEGGARASTAVRDAQSQFNFA